VGIGKPVQQNAVDKAVDGGVGADAQRNRENCHDGEAGSGTHHAEGETKIVDERVHKRL